MLLSLLWCAGLRNGEGLPSETNIFRIREDTYTKIKVTWSQRPVRGRRGPEGTWEGERIKGQRKES